MLPDSKVKSIRFDGKTFSIELDYFFDPSSMNPEENVAQRTKKVICELFGNNVEVKCKITKITKITKRGDSPATTPTGPVTQSSAHSWPKSVGRTFDTVWNTIVNSMDELGLVPEDNSDRGTGDGREIKTSKKRIKQNGYVYEYFATVRLHYNDAFFTVEVVMYQRFRPVSEDEFSPAIQIDDKIYFAKLKDAAAENSTDNALLSAVIKNLDKMAAR
jgi:hypothetical protein